MSFIGKVFAWIGGIFHKAENELKHLLPVVTGFIQGVKSLDDTIGDPLAHLLGGVALDLQTKIKAVLPNILEKLGLLTVVETSVTDADLQAALAKFANTIKLSSSEERQRFLTTFGSMLVMQLHNGTLTFATAAIDLEYWYQNNVKAPETVATNTEPSPALAPENDAPATDES